MHFQNFFFVYFINDSSSYCFHKHISPRYKMNIALLLIFWTQSWLGSYNIDFFTKLITELYQSHLRISKENHLKNAVLKYNILNEIVIVCLTTAGEDFSDAIKKRDCKNKGQKNHRVKHFFRNVYLVGLD